MDENSAPHYVGFWARFVATLIDSVLMCFVLIPLLVMVYGWEYFESQEMLLGPADVLISWILPAVLVVALWIKLQATPGKLAVNAVIVDARTLGKPSTGQLIGRYFAYFLSSLVLCLGFVWVAFDRRKQGWHDKLAGTVVIRRQA